MMKPRNIIIDTDPGIDDAAAITIAVRNAALNVKLISTVAANVEVEKTTENALKLMEFLDADIPVARGCDAPLLKKLEPCPEIHGVSGMDGYDFPKVKRQPLRKHSVEAMREVIMDSDEKITLAALATHTNIAILLRMYPEVKEKIDEIVMMGGGLSGGNTNTVAEFNLYNDPHAAYMVFESGLPITMLGLDVTNKAILHKNTALKIRESGKEGDMLYSLFEHYRGGTFEEGLRIHDACVMAYMLRPELFKTEKMYVGMVTEGYAQGATVAGKVNPIAPGREPNVNVCVHVDEAAFEEWFAGEFCR
ncbi:ribonucleoside hydrolase RihC [Emergencia sp.]|uniref:ribonucleoside hydrolase RihC n=1 Tax=Emergencia sp. TaxID=1926557 RepID=UPI003AF101EF